MNTDTKTYNHMQSAHDKKICDKLERIITANLRRAENKIWHGHPVWFINGNPIVGYSKLKDSIRLMFWSGADFREPLLKPGTGKFKDASIRYTDEKEIDENDVKRWLKKAESIQWDYKNIYKRIGKLVKLNIF